jgi:hypothetical protein
MSSEGRGAKLTALRENIVGELKTSDVMALRWYLVGAFADSGMSASV